MSAVLSEIGSRWSALPSRTRTLAIGAGVLILMFVLYSAVWRPLQNDLKNLRASVPGQTEQLEWMRAQAPVANALKAKSIAGGDNLMQTIEQTATTQNLRSYIARIDSEGPAGVRITLENVSFNAMVSWLSDLHTNYGAMVDDATVEARPASGLVNARIRLRAGGA
ncbi:MAG TPA: type II secretion system protein M [Burkholderiales bacterium]|nr:type II secretion system protein M [Burkholderiales bacterium]